MASRLTRYYVQVKNWVNTGIKDDKPQGIVHRDSNGVIFEVGDAIVLIKDLKGKGCSMIAK